MSLEDGELKFQRSQEEILRRKEILKPDEKVEAVATLWKYPMSISLFGAFARFMQKRYLLAVTDKRVLFAEVPAFLVHKEWGYRHVSVPRPCALKMSAPPEKQHQNGNIVMLPPELAAFVGKPNVRLIWGLMGQQAFESASRPAAQER
jgi:hypothetical protein